MFKYSTHPKEFRNIQRSKEKEFLEFPISQIV